MLTALASFSFNCLVSSLISNVSRLTSLVNLAMFREDGLLSVRALVRTLSFLLFLLRTYLSRCWRLLSVEVELESAVLLRGGEGG